MVFRGPFDLVVMDRVSRQQSLLKKLNWHGVLRAGGRTLVSLVTTEGISMLRNDHQIQQIETEETPSKAENSRAERVESTPAPQPFGPCDTPSPKSSRVTISWHPSRPHEWVLNFTTDTYSVCENYSCLWAALQRGDDLKKGTLTPSVSKYLTSPPD